MSAHLQIRLLMGKKVTPLGVESEEMGLQIESAWMVDGVPQPVKDPAIVIAALTQALAAVTHAVPWNPPKILEGAILPP